MRKGSLLALAAVASMAAPAAAQVPAGGQFRLNSYTTDFQGTPAVASAPNGAFTAVWISGDQDGSGVGVFGQRFDAAGAPAGAEFAVATYTTNWQTLPDIAVDARGNFVVAWTSNGNDGAGYGVFGQRFSAEGSRLGAEFAVNTYTTDWQYWPAVAADPHGDFVVVWQSFGQDGNYFGCFGQRFSAAGTPRGAEFVLATFTTGQQTLPAVAVDRNGNFVAAWDNFSSGSAVFARRFAANGTPLGAEFVVGGSVVNWPSVASDPAGNFVVVGSSYPGDVFGVRFNAAGTPLGTFRANTYTTGDQRIAQVASDAAGNFVVIWQSRGQDGSGDGIFGQRFSAGGAPRGAEFRVNSATSSDQAYAGLASDAVGNFVVAWQDPSQDGSDSGAFAQRFGGLEPAALGVDTGANGVLDPGETVAVQPSWTNVNGAPQTFGGGLGAFTGPAGPTYTITDGSASYGTVASGATAPCTDCYAVSVSNPATRPVQHWDASARESITPDAQGQVKEWVLHVGGSFTDVPASNGFYPFIETLFHKGVTGGCGGTSYCPGSATTREQMSVFVLVAKEGAGYAPPACGTPVFNDVPASSPYCRFIEELAHRGVVGGCGGSSFCPADPATREQMSIFTLRTLDPALSPPACGTPMFADVPASSPFCRWIEELARRGVVTGCGGGNYCPTGPVTREQMGVFIGATFGLTLYGT